MEIMLKSKYVILMRIEYAIKAVFASKSNNL